MNNGCLVPSAKIEHFCILALRKDELKSWYQEMFGFSSIYIDGKESTFIKSANGMILEFIDAESARTQDNDNVNGFQHIAFSVESIDEVEKKLAEMNIDIIRRSASPSGDTKMLFFRDPEGNMIQIVYRKNPLYVEK